MVKNIIKYMIYAIMLFLLAGCITVVHEAPPTQVTRGDGAELQGVPVIQEKEDKILEPAQEEQIQEADPEPIQEKEIEPVQGEKSAELSEIKKEEITEDKPKEYIKELLTEIPNKYWYYTTNDGIGGIVYDSKRASGWVGLDRKLRLFYWDATAKEVFIFYDYVSEARLLKIRNIDDNSRSRESFLAFIKQEITGDEYPKSPVDWMHEYADKTPSKVETSAQMLQADSMPYTCNLRLYFQNDDDTITVLKFDKIHKVPLQVEKRWKESIVEHYNYRFDTLDRDLDFSARRTPITEERVTLPDNHVIITIEEAEKIKREKITDAVNPHMRVKLVMELFQEVSDARKSTY